MSARIGQRVTLAIASVLLVASVAVSGSAKASSAPKAKAEVPGAVPAGNAARGAQLYQICSGCHSLDQNEIGPRHRGVVGRKAGTVPGYAYSAALRAAGLTWTPAKLDKWLTNPQGLVKGSRMFFAVAKPQDRADLIAYLEQQR
jgi:cytochrome c